LLDETFLLLELPTFQYPVIYEEKLYQGSTEQLTIEQALMTDEDLVNAGVATISKGKEDIIEFDSSAFTSRAFSGLYLYRVADWEIGEENLSEAMYKRLTRDVTRGGAEDASQPPNKEEREELQRIINNPSDHHMTEEDKDLIWRFRYALIEDPNALTKFLLSVDWTLEDEISEVEHLLSVWKQISISDALKLLGKF